MPEYITVLDQFGGRARLSRCGEDTWEVLVGGATTPDFLASPILLKEYRYLGGSTLDLEALKASMPILEVEGTKHGRFSCAGPNLSNRNPPSLLKERAVSSYCPDFSQIPTLALERLAQRYELGAKKYGEDNWRKALDDPKYLIERLNHVIEHAKRLQDKVKGRRKWDADDDAAAIMWGAAFAIEALQVQGLDVHIDPTEEVDAS